MLAGKKFRQQRLFPLHLHRQWYPASNENRTEKGGTMSHRNDGRGVLRLAILVGVVLTGVGTLFAVGVHGSRVKQNLNPTSMAPNANGKAQLTLKSSKNGKFQLTAKHLAGGKQFDVIVGGVKVGSMTTSAGGSGHARFKTQPSGKFGMLGFDPRGSQVIV